MSNLAYLVLADGAIFKGVSIGAPGSAVGEVVFNTAMTGYQEILTDPSYAQQLVTLTYPHIGNTGINVEDAESSCIYASGLIIRELSLVVSNFRSQTTLMDYLQSQNIVAIAEVDTRRLTRLIRKHGVQSACIIVGDKQDIPKAVKQAQQYPGLQGMDLAKTVTINSIQYWRQGCWQLGCGYKTVEDTCYHVVAYDFGIKRNILRQLAERSCLITIVPATTTADEVLQLKPDGVFLSNGPGDPESCGYAIEAITKLLTVNLPIFGICLGYQLLALASGAKTIKMKFGHHGANHPVYDLKKNKVVITSQNHGFTVNESSLPEHVEVTHKSLFDASLQGIAIKGKPAFGFQGHPEASPGPHDASQLFDRFVQLMANANNNVTSFTNNKVNN